MPIAPGPAAGGSRTYRSVPRAPWAGSCGQRADSAARSGSTPRGSGRRRRRYFDLPGDGEVRAAVPRPALLVGLLAERDLLAVRHRLQAGGVDAQRDQVVVGGLRAPLAQRQVVLDRAALVAVALDRDAEEVELLQGVGVLRQDRAVAVAQVGAVVVEVDVGEQAHLLHLVDRLLCSARTRSASAPTPAVAAGAGGGVSGAAGGGVGAGRRRLLAASRNGDGERESEGRGW